MKKMAIVDKKGLEYIPNIDRMIREKECRELTTLAKQHTLEAGEGRKIS